MPPTPEGRMSAAGDGLLHEFCVDDFYLQKVEALGMYLASCVTLQEYIHSNISQKTEGEHNKKC